MELVYRVIPNYPKVGVNFIDMDSLYRTQLNPICHNISRYIADHDVIPEAIVAIGSRGWVTGSVVAYMWNLPIFLARDESKALKDWVFTEPFENEYAGRRFGISSEVTKYKSVIIIDDLIATGNTIASVEKLMYDLGVKVSQIISTIKLREFNPQFKAPLYCVKEISCKDL